ncbi:MAG: sulfotransferase domain-containing protein [Myxococcales bacterium]|nr:sulfotransferase domain-containing protein [Myxococcales bacterium]
MRTVHIPSLRRSGGTLVGRLLDGHPSCNHLPFEYWHTREKGHLDDSDLMLFPYSTPLERAVMLGLWSPLTRQKLQRLLNETQLQAFDEQMLNRLRSSVSRCPKMAYRAVVEVFHSLIGDSLRAVSVNHSAETVLLGYETAQKWIGADLYILPVRDPRAMYCSLRALFRRNKFSPWLARQGELDTFCNNYRRLILEWVRPKHPNVHVLSFERLLAVPDVAMREVAEFISIPFTPSLIEPTLSGQKAQSNSSFTNALGLDPKAPSRWKSLLEPEVVEALHDRLADVWPGDNDAIAV